MIDEEIMKMQYCKILNKMLSLRNMLADILLQFGVIDQDNGESFHQLLSYVKFIDTMISYSETIDEFDTSSHLFFNEQDPNTAIEQYLSDSFAQCNVADVNMLLMQKVASYCAYLYQYLLAVGVDEEIVREKYTLKHFIQCLHQVEHRSKLRIEVYNDILYRNVHNNLIMNIFDDVGNIVNSGTLIILENNNYIYEGNFEEAYIQPATMGNHTYTFRFIPDDQTYYKISQATYTLNVQATPIQIEINATNISQNSIYYNSYMEGYGDDEWEITIQTKDPLGNLLSNIPLKIYANDKLINENNTDIFGQYVYHGTLPYSSDSEDFVTCLQVQTLDFNPAFLNSIEEYNFTIYHYQITVTPTNVSPENLISVYLTNQLTGEKICNDALLQSLDIEINGEAYTTSMGECERTCYSPALYDTYTMHIYDTNEGIDQTVLIKVQPPIIFPLENEFIFPDYPIIQCQYDQSTVIVNDTEAEVIDGIIQLPTSLMEIGEHTIQIQNTNDTFSYSYTIKKPLELTQISNDQTCALYQLKVYDKMAVDKAEGFLMNDIYQQYTIHTPNEFTICFLNKGYSFITIYDANINVLNIANEYNNIIIDDDEININKTNADWNKITVKIDESISVYVDDVQQYTKSIIGQHDALEIYIMSNEGYYQNFKIKRNEFITVTSNDRSVEYNYTKTEYTDYYRYNINVCKNEYNEGTNTICATINTYSECDDFNLYSRAFRVLPDNTLKVGYNELKIQCFDDNVNSITIINNNITQNNVTKVGDVYTVDCDIYQAGSLSITIQDNNGYSEDFVISVAKGDYTIDLDMPENREYTDHTPIPLSIKDAFNNEVNTFYCYFDNNTPLNITKTNNSITLDGAIGNQYDNLDMDEHTITVRTIDNSNYNIATVTETFLLGVYISTIIQQPLFTNLTTDNDGWLLEESMNVNESTTISDLESVLVGINTSVDVDPGRLILSEFISNDPNKDNIILLDDDFNNIQNAIVDIDKEEDKLTYTTIKNDNL